MSNQIFRQEAMDRMASPDRLDHPIRLVRDRQWLLLACVGVTLGMVLVWSFWASLPIKVDGRGILINSVGLSEVSIAYDGRVEEILVQTGDVVNAGQVVARMTRDIKQHEIDIATAALTAATDSAKKAALAFAESQARYQEVERKRLNSIAKRSEDLRQQLETRRQLANDLRALVSKGAVTPLELVNVVTTIDSLEENLRQLEQESLEIRVARAERLDTREQAELSEQQAVTQRRLELLQLQAETEDAIDVTAVQEGQIAEIKANAGDVLAAGKALALINPNTGPQGTQAVLFLDPTQGKKVRAGMRVEIVPGSAEKEIYGHIKARVISTATLPASREGMRRVLQNDRLIDELSVSGPPIQVLAELSAADNPSGFSWSASAGPAYPITSGTLLDAKVVVERRALVDVILPGLRKPAHKEDNG